MSSRGLLASFYFFSASELTQQVAALSPEERVLFGRLFHSMEKRTLETHGSAPATWPDFGERLRAIYSDTVAPDSQIIVDEGRGRR